jgi:hypothetical protein
MRDSQVRMNVVFPAELFARLEASRMPGESTAQAVRRLLHNALPAPGPVRP